MKKWFLSSLVFLSLVVLQIQADVFSDPVLAEIRQLHDAAINGNNNDVAKAESVINAALARNPGNQLYHVYLGSLLTIKSSKAFPGPAKLRFLKEGLANMDAAVETEPQNAAVRFIRAVNNYMLPRFFNRRDKAAKDFLILTEAIKDPKIQSQFDTQTLQAIYYFAGLTFKEERQTEQAIAAWNKGLKLADSTEISVKINKELKKISKN